MVRYKTFLGLQSTHSTVAGTELRNYPPKQEVFSF